MGLKALLESVPDELRAHYVQVADGPHKGKWRLDVENVDGYGIEDVGALKRSLSAMRDERDRADRNTTAYKDLGDVDTIKDRLAALEKLKGAIPKDQLQQMVEQTTAELKKAHAKQLDEVGGKASRYEKAVRRLAVEAEARRLLLEAGALPESVDLLVGKAVEFGQVEWPDNADMPAVRVRGPNGVALPSSKQGQVEMDLAELVGGFREKYPPCFKPNGAPGGGATGGGSPSGGARAPGQIPVSRLNDIPFYRTVAAEAAKAGVPVTPVPG